MFIVVNGSFNFCRMKMKLGKIMLLARVPPRRFVYYIGDNNLLLHIFHFIFKLVAY